MNFSSISIGALHIPVFGLFAAVGLMAAMLLSQRTAIFAGVPAQQLWNFGLVAISSAFLVSRVLLVTGDWRAFRAEPMLVLALPSLTFAGIWITCLFMFVYLRLRRLPVLPVLDALAPCAALVWFMLSLGHFAEGTSAGMPTRLPWGVTTFGDTVLGKVHPTQLYTALAAVALLVLLLWFLPRRRYPGDVAAVALIAGGTGDFLIGLLRQPYDTYGESWLDPAQIVALLLVFGGGLMLAIQGPVKAKRVQQELQETEAVHAK